MTLQPTEITTRLEFALDVARQASELILLYYRSVGLRVELKSDRTPVTVADREAEQLLRNEIQRRFPQDGILGEEFGEIPSKNGYRWILDPIDGTKSFVHGVPLFGTLIGLEHQESVMMGVCRFPALDEVVYAATGNGAWWQRGEENPRAAHVSDVADLSAALFCTTTITGWQLLDQRDLFDRLCRQTGLTRGWGDCYGHILVATGRAELMVDPELNAWDAAPLLPILQEAGGHFVDFDGKPSIHSGNGVSVNASLKEDVLALLAG